MHLVFLLYFILVGAQETPPPKVQPLPILTYVADPQKQSIAVYWKDDAGKTINTIENLINWQKTKKRDVVFAANGGMFMEDFSPLGLFVENGKIWRKLITKKKAYGNFYLQPNGVFMVGKDKKASVVATDDFKMGDGVDFATQSGPLMVHKGEINALFKKGSANLDIRNGVGILPDGKVLFAMSQSRINFYDFATFFKDQGCKEALFLDGSISQTYHPEKGVKQIYGPLGVLIGITKPL